MENKEKKGLNEYWCDNCKKHCVATKPTKYVNCPCGGELRPVDGPTEKKYNQIDHTHCFDQENPPCGIKGEHRCCLCTMSPTEKAPEEEMARSLFNGFIEKWCPDNFRHFIDTDENEAERFRRRMDSLLAQAHQRGVEEGKSTAVFLVAEFVDELIDLAITNQPLRGCVTSNQILETHKNFWSHTHDALDITSQYQRGVEEERGRIEDVFRKQVPPHGLNLEDGLWLKRLLNKAFKHEKS